MLNHNAFKILVSTVVLFTIPHGAAGVTEIADVVVPESFGPYTQQLTERKSRLIRSGAIEVDEFLNTFLAGGGLTVHAPSYKDLDDDADNVSSDTGSDATTAKIGTSQEVAVRLSRNKSWATADLTAALAGTDPADAISNRVADYWVRRVQSAFIATMTGVFADNAAAPSASEHVQNDMTYNVSGVSFVDGVTNFTAEAFIDATLTMGDSAEDVQIVMMHSIVYGRMQKNNLIDFIQDSVTNITIPTFLGRQVVVDDGMPVSSGVYETWLFGRGAVRFGRSIPKVGTELSRSPLANNGGGEETLTNRVEWVIHPRGLGYVGTPAVGGPSNAATTNNLAAAGSWQRAFSERKQIKIARLITREN